MQLHMHVYVYICVRIQLITERTIRDTTPNQTSELITMGVRFTLILPLPLSFIFFE